ncbi:hypothetical protein OAS39_12315 [Pirellulales bacterium]|nr:hypothetical protein [Pirellulales bacterium]
MSDVHAALAYYFDHKAEIDAQMNAKAAKAAAAKAGSESSHAT